MSVAGAVQGAFSRDDPRFLFGARADLLAFGGAALFSCSLLGVGMATGTMDSELSPWLWLLFIVGIDVAHVWSTIFRVYLDPVEVRRRLALYVGTPIGLYALGCVLYGFSAAVFWRVVAYAAVWHFMRQQIGWVRLYHRRDEHIGAFERRLDEALLWLVMLHPIAYWHAHLPRRFAWMVAGDFVGGLSPRVADTIGLVTVGVAALWLALQARGAARGRALPWGRSLLVGTTAAAWYLGIVVFDSDFAFTVTNIPLHGVPYALLTFRYGKARVSQTSPRPLTLLLRGGVPAFLLVLWGLALLEELGWDRLVWHDHPMLFGTSGVLGDEAVALVAPLLAIPQLTHYVLDGFVWRRAGND